MLLPRKKRLNLAHPYLHASGIGERGIWPLPPAPFPTTQKWEKLMIWLQLWALNTLLLSYCFLGLVGSACGPPRSLALSEVHHHFPFPSLFVGLAFRLPQGAMWLVPSITLPCAVSQLREVLTPDHVIKCWPDYWRLPLNRGLLPNPVSL